MSKKSFKDSNPAMAFISKPETDDKDTKESKSAVDRELHNTDNAPDTQEVQDAQHAQGVHDTQEEQSIKKVPKTQGRKGQKLPRINMAFDEENIEYLRLMSRVRGISMTQYVNDLLDQDRKTNEDIVKKAEKLLDM